MTKKTKKILWVVGGLAVTGAVIGGAVYYTRKKKSAPAEAPAQEQAQVQQQEVPQNRWLEAPPPGTSAGLRIGHITRAGRIAAR